MAKKDRIKKKKSNVITVDFTGVEAGGVVVPEGPYEVKAAEVELKNSENSGNDYLSWTFEIVSPEKLKGKKLFHNTSLSQQSLWSLRGLLEVMGVEIPDEPLELDLDDMIDRTVGAEVQHETYEGKKKPRIVDFFEFTDEGEKDEEEEEAPKKKKSKKVEEEEEEEEAPKKKSKKEPKKKKVVTMTSDEVLEKDEEELGELIEEHELDVDLSDFNTLRRKRAAVVEALEEKGLIEDAEEA